MEANTFLSLSDSFGFPAVSDLQYDGAQKIEIKKGFIQLF